MTVSEYFDQLIAHMGLSGATITTEERLDEDGRAAVLVKIAVAEDDAGALIGRRGEVVYNLQRLGALSLKDELGDRRLLVNVNDYLERKEESLIQKAKRAAEIVETERRPYTFRGLSPAERRVIHLALKDNARVRTESHGEGRERALIVLSNTEPSMDKTQSVQEKEE